MAWRQTKPSKWTVLEIASKDGKAVWARYPETPIFNSLVKAHSHARELRQQFGLDTQVVRADS